MYIAQTFKEWVVPEFFAFILLGLTGAVVGSYIIKLNMKVWPLLTVVVLIQLVEMHSNS